jgi:hypothetical protein
MELLEDVCKPDWRQHQQTYLNVVRGAGDKSCSAGGCMLCCASHHLLPYSMPVRPLRWAVIDARQVMMVLLVVKQLCCRHEVDQEVEQNTRTVDSGRCCQYLLHS